MPTPYEQSVLDKLASGNMGSLTKKDWQAVRVMEATNNARAAIGQAPTYNYTPANSNPAPAQQGQDQSGNDTSGGESAEEAYWKQRATDEANARRKAEREAREGAEAFLTSILRQYQMDGLANSVSSLVQQWGTNTEVIGEKLRQTSEYKTRFRGMLDLQKSGVTDIRNEGEYLALESEYRRVFRDNNLSTFLGEAGSQGEYDAIADIVGKFSISVNEVRDRISDAQRVVADTPAEVRQSLQQYYNVDADSLVAYTLDPDRAGNMINRMANAAIVGGMAQQSDLQFGREASESIADSIAGTNDITAGRLRPSLTSIATQRDATARLADLEKSTLSDEEVAFAELDLDSQAKKKVKGLQSRERARFSGTSSITSGALNRNRGS